MTSSVLNATPSRQRTSAGAIGEMPASRRLEPAEYAAGRVLSGRFRIEHLIGRGSMGVVLAARHIDLDARVAIKAIAREMQAFPGVLARFAREAKAAVAIRSEHVARVFDVGTDDELGPYIVMEYLEGRDLRGVLELDGRVPVRRAVEYVLQACEALAAAHANGVIHRDIKPENLFLTRHGDLEVLKLLDFGISKASLTGQLFGGEVSADDASFLMGTPLYMSPEQIHSLEQVDARADIWSLGAVLYELLTGHSAFGSSASGSSALGNSALGNSAFCGGALGAAALSGGASAGVGSEDLQILLRNVLEGTPVPLAQRGADAGLELQGVIDRCLQKDPARRFQNVAELAYALLPFASSRARLHAPRAASILGTRPTAESSASASPAPLSADPLAPATPPLNRERAPRMLLRGALLRSGPGRLLAGMLIAAPFIVFGARWLGLQPGAAHPARAQASALASAHELPISRRVLVESQPSGAVVKIEGQSIGLTPLSTLLPAGAVLLSLERAGFTPAQIPLVIEPPSPGAKPVLTRVVLQPVLDPVVHAELPEPAAPEASTVEVAPAAPEIGHRTARNRASASSVKDARPAPDRPRLRLVEDPPAARR